MRMNLALRSSARISQTSSAIFFPKNLHPRRSGPRSSTTICFSSASDAEQSPEMDTVKAQELPEEEENENVMSSFGEGYSTRSDEEGFGGIYGRNDDDEASGMMKKKEEEKETDVHENNPERDKEQGSEVKEKARHQTNRDT